MRDTSGKKLHFVSVGITQIALMFKKASSIHFQEKTRHKMVVSRQLESQFSRGIGPHRGRGFGALAQVVVRTVIRFLPNYTVPAANLVCADLLEFTAPENAQIVSGRKNFKRTAKVWDGKL